MREREGSLLGFYMIVIAAFFLVGFLLLVVFDARIYRNAVAAQEQNNQTRALLSYLAASVRSNDAGASILVRADGPEDSDVLVIRDAAGYAQRIYRYDSYLVEDYAAADAAYDPEDALSIGRTETFSIDYNMENGMLHIVTDEGEAVLHVYSRGGINE